MAKPYAKKFYNSRQWKECRDAYISSVHGLCEHCFERGKSEPGYIVDHIVEISPININDPSVTLNHDNLQYLCLPCHTRKTFSKYSPINDDLMFDENGDIQER